MDIRHLLKIGLIDGMYFDKA